MKKTLLFMLLLALLAPWTAKAQTTVEIGDETNSNYNLPINTYYNYSLTQQIYTADEIGMAGTITSISFDYTYTTSYTMNDIQVYMLNTDKEQFETTTDMVAVTSSDKVFEGAMTLPAGGGWTTIELDNAFEYDGTSNLLICFFDPTNGYQSNSCKFRYTSTTNYMGIDYYSDSYCPDVNNVTSFTGSKNRRQYHPNIRIEITPSGSTICEKPATIEVSQVTTNGARISWTGGSGSYNFAWKKASDDNWVTNTTTNTYYELANLDPGTRYEVRVQSVCGTDDLSGWRSTDFKTLFGIPLNEPFDAASTIPDGWSKYFGLLDGVMDGSVQLATTTGGWSFTTNNGVFDNHARLNIYGSSVKHWLATPTIRMEDNVQLTFDLALTKYSGSTPTPIVDTLGEDDRFAVVIAVFDERDTTLTILREWNNTGSEYVYNDIACSAAGENITIDLSRFAGQDIAIAFYGESTVAQSGSDNNLHIDNVSIDYVPECAKPTSLAYSDVTAHEVTLNWVSDANTWYVYYADNASFENYMVIQKIGTPTITLDGLAGETTYYVRVQTECGTGIDSDYSNTIHFTTAVACPAPTGLTRSNVTNHGATFDWTSDASSWILAYKTIAETEFTEIEVSEKPYTLDRLEPETNYSVKVRSNCGGVDGVSAWTSTNTFTTLDACPAPTNLTCTAYTVNSVTLSWFEGGDATEWNLQYWTGGDTATIAVTTNPYTLERLTSETVYGARVSSACSSSWSNVVSFEPTEKLVIGSGPSTSSFLPTNTNYNYSYTQQIYTVEELGEAGLIESIDFYMTSTAAYTRNLDIYMVSTDKNTFENNSEWITVTDADKVFSGEVEFLPQAWTTIALDADFVYDGEQNVAIIVDDNTGVWSSRSFRVFSATGNQSHYYYRDPSDIVPNEAGTNGTVTSTKNQIRILKNELSDCMKPSHFVATEVGPDFVTFDWNENGEAESWCIFYNEEFVIVTEHPYTIRDLDPSTAYDAMVMPMCGVIVDGSGNASIGDEMVESNWVTFTTLDSCPAPFDVEVNATHNSAAVTWSGYSDSYNVQLGWDQPVDTYFEDDFANGISASWINDTVYAWTVVSGHLQCGNTGVASSTSSISVEVVFRADGVVEFDAECMGEGTSSIWDHCDFYIDDERVLYAGANIPDWNHYRFEVAAGEHTFKWSYTKDSSVDPNGDYFAIDNVRMATTELYWGRDVNVSDTEYTFANLTPSTNYYLRIRGFCDGNESEWSEILEFTTERLTSITQTTDLTRGWNWFSAYVEVEDPADLLLMLEESLGENGIQIKNADYYTAYEDEEWFGDLDDEGLYVEQMYKILVETDCTAEIEGLIPNLEEHPITIEEGWNWIGFPVSEVTAIEDAMADFEAEEGDIIKNSEDFTSYEDGEWFGDIEEMVPGQGYMYFSNSSDEKELIYQTAAKHASKNK